MTDKIERVRLPEDQYDRPATCSVTATVKTAGFRGETLLFRCDREPNHEDQHHGIQPSGSEMFWGADKPTLQAAGDPAGHKPGDPHNYRLECTICGQHGVITVSVNPERVLAPDPGNHHAYPDPNFPSPELVEKIDREVR